MFEATQLQKLVWSIIYSVLGALIFGGVFWLFNKLCPFSLRKEIEEDQNTAVAIIMGSVFVSLAVIIAAAIT
jgi:putative membrane protein